MEYSSIFVCLMGMGTVFFGLICLIALTYLMSAVVGRGKKAAPAPVPAAPQTAGEVTPELVAAVSAAPMAARVSQMVGQKYNPGNFLLMHAMGPNVAGVIGSAIAAGVLISLYG